MDEPEVGDVASWAMAEAVLHGADPQRFLGRPYDECTPEAVIMACVDALEQVTELDAYAEMLRAIKGVSGMTKERFVDIWVEEGMLNTEAELVWEQGEGYDINYRDLSETEVRSAARMTLPIARQLREYKL